MSSVPILHGIMACFDVPYASTMNKSNGAKMLWKVIISPDDWNHYQVTQGKALMIIKEDIEIKLGQMLNLRNKMARDNISNEEYDKLMEEKIDYEDSIAKWLVGDSGNKTW